MSGMGDPLVPSGAFLARPRVLAGAMVGLGAGAAWVALAWLHAAEAEAPMGLAELCLAPHAAGTGGFGALSAMWVLMGAAMMLPTAAPAIDLYIRLAARMEARAGLHLAAFAGGYLAVWSAFGLAAAALQARAGPALAALPADAVSGALLLIAGAWQLTPLKEACLAACRNPLGFFMRHWRDGPAGALRLGCLHGAVCLGCCWALMGLMLIAGAMNLLWMAALGLLMLAEKTLPWADRAGRGLGLALCLAGAALLARAAA